MAGRVGLAVFGPGSMGVVHVQNILMSGRASLKWIIRNNKEEGERYLKERGIDAGCTTPGNLGSVLEDPSVQGVVICSPSSSHEAIITSSLEAGKAVFCEKPITTDLESTGKCYDLAEKQGLPLLCAFNRRFDPSFKALRDRVKSGELGDLRMIRTSSRDHKPPPAEYLKTSGGIFFDTVIHDLDITSWVVGSKPSKVFSQGHASSPHFSECNDIDLQVTSVYYENGVIGILDNLRQSLYGYDQRLEAVCERGMVTVANRPVDLVTEHGPAVTSAPRVGKTFQHRYPEAYAAELDHFVDVIQGKAPLSVTKEETLQAMRLADACKQSFNSGQPVTV